MCVDDEGFGWGKGKGGARRGGKGHKVMSKRRIVQVGMIGSWMVVKGRVVSQTATQVITSRVVVCCTLKGHYFFLGF